VERIADAALSILEAKGPQAVTMRQVAEAVGITPMAIYYHFPNREALLDRRRHCSRAAREQWSWCGTTPQLSRS
jgi:AcrR family transcriptional regulator